MTTTTEYDGEKAYMCEECGMHYRKEELAERCEKYCREEGMCNSEITRKSMERSG
ncbi:hypothetical protein GKQ38_01900 [Candidatus Nanohaloarchaea archaeon]|nr:hypothetical protein GKQ38_01900 [Candidatus Nanohaloarchaea archaeon]